MASDVPKHSSKPKTSSLKHLKFNWKKQQLQEDKITEIERENRILLEKMRNIHLKGKKQNALSSSQSKNQKHLMNSVISETESLSAQRPQPPKVLNYGKKAEREKIMAEN